jgi:hypothetical protein
MIGLLSNATRAIDCELRSVAVSRPKNGVSVNCVLGHQQDVSGEIADLGDSIRRTYPWFPPATSQLYQVVMAFFDIARLHVHLYVRSRDFPVMRPICPRRLLQCLVCRRTFKTCTGGAFEPRHVACLEKHPHRVRPGYSLLYTTR